MTHRREDEEGNEADNKSIDQRSLTYKVVFGILVFSVIGLITIIYGGVTTRASSAEDRFEKRCVIMDARIDRKIDREEHYKDMAEIRSYFLEIRQAIHNYEEKGRKRGE